MDINQQFFKKSIVPEWDGEIALLKNIHQIVNKFVKAETAYIKALHEIQSLRLKDSFLLKNKGLVSIQIALMNFITSLETQHGEVISNLKEDILSDFEENQEIQKAYRENYVSFESVVYQLSLINERASGECDSLAHYKTLLHHYNEAVAQLYEEEDELGREEVQELYSECDHVYNTLVKQRDLNQSAFLTICDNYCRIRYNNLSIVVSSIRKFFVYISSAVANTQFDIQAISQKLSSFPPTNCYILMKEELDQNMPEYSQSGIFSCSRAEVILGPELPTSETMLEPKLSTSETMFGPKLPTSETILEPESSSSSERITRCHSEECPIPTIPIHHWKQPAKSADMIEDAESNDIYPLSIQLLEQIAPHRERLNPFIIRDILAILSTFNTDELEQAIVRIDNYLHTSDIAPIHISYLLLSVILFISPERLSHQNCEKVTWIVSKLREQTPCIPPDVITVLTNYIQC